jgi:Calpain family cysteine protease
MDTIFQSVSASKKITSGIVYHKSHLALLDSLNLCHRLLDDCRPLCTAFELRFQNRLVTAIIYPQDSSVVPLPKPHGKYMVQLWLNGFLARAVVVDNVLAVDQHGRLLRSHTKSPGLEWWVSIFEKALMKQCVDMIFLGRTVV